MAIPVSEADLIRWAGYALESGSPQYALEMLQQLPLERLEDPEAAYLLGSAYEALGRLQEAQEAFARTRYFEGRNARLHVQSQWRAGLLRSKSTPPTNAHET